MREFDYIIIGGGCSGLSLAYELEINEKLKDKTLAKNFENNSYLSLTNIILLRKIFTLRIFIVHYF